ncbi:MAG: hypothetical protein ABIH39_01435 [Candidatus Margulisiibacteriota bacterium]
MCTSTFTDAIRESRESTLTTIYSPPKQKEQKTDVKLTLNNTEKDNNKTTE